MANSNWLKQNWLALCIIGVFLSLGIAFGVIQNQQKTNTVEIDKKLDKEIFQMYSQQQTMIFAEIKTDIAEQRLEQKADMKEIKELIKNGR